MELSWLLTQSIFTMALMIMVGFVAAKLKVLNYEASGMLSTMTLYIIAPCMLFSAYQIEFTWDKLIGLGVGAVAAVVVHIIYIPATKLLGRIFGLSRIDRASIVYSNAGNLIIPLVGYVLGEEYVFYTSAYVTVQTILIWTHGVTLVSDKAQMNFKKIITNPSIIAIVLGLVMFLLPVSVPSPIENTIDKIGAMVGPVSMIGIGIIMSTLPLKAVFMDLRAYFISFLRLILLPALFIIVIRLSGITQIMPDMKMVLLVTVLAACAPTAVSITQQARVFDEDAASASVINVMTTILCIITMPLMTIFYQLLCY